RDRSHAEPARRAPLLWRHDPRGDRELPGHVAVDDRAPLAPGPRVAAPAPPQGRHMTGDVRWSEVERLFDLAVALHRTEHAAFLDQTCVDPALRREVESLLRADEQAAGFLEPAPPARGEGLRIGAYRLLRKLGEGETSTVHLAVRDDDQYQQCVAIKLIR